MEHTGVSGKEKNHPLAASGKFDVCWHNRILKKNIVRLSRKFNLDFTEDIGPLIDCLLELGLLKDYEIIQSKELDKDG